MRTNNSAAVSVWRRALCVWLITILVMGLAACGGEAREPLRAPEKTEVPTIAIETVYGTLAFPETLQDNLRHMEVTDGSIAMEVFYMVAAAGEKELYRIHYADAQVGTLVGYLTIDGKEIPVSSSTCEYTDEAFADEEERKLYYSMMDAFSTVMNSLYADPRFNETRAAEPVGAREIKLRHWKVTIPENVQYVEKEENGTYQVDFYGEVSGEQIRLFTIGLGNIEAETMLGMYTVDGIQKPIMVEAYSMEQYAMWPEEDQTIIYKMMESLNTIIQTIVTDKNFVEPASGVG